MSSDSIGRKSWHATNIEEMLISRTVANVLKSDVKNSVGSIQVCASQAGFEAEVHEVHAIHHIFDQED